MNTLLQQLTAMNSPQEWRAYLIDLLERAGFELEPVFENRAVKIKRGGLDLGATLQFPADGDEFILIYYSFPDDWFSRKLLKYTNHEDRFRSTRELLIPKKDFHKVVGYLVRQLKEVFERLSHIQGVLERVPADFFNKNGIKYTPKPKHFSGDVEAVFKDIRVGDTPVLDLRLGYMWKYDSISVHIDPFRPYDDNCMEDFLSAVKMSDDPDLAATYKKYEFWHSSSGWWSARLPLKLLAPHLYKLLDFLFKGCLKERL